MISSELWYSNIVSKSCLVPWKRVSYNIVLLFANSFGTGKICMCGWKKMSFVINEPAYGTEWTCLQESLRHIYYYYYS